MATAETLRVVDAYHQAWTTKRFDDAVAQLAPSLKVEVPINSYATPEAFAEALVRFGSQVTSVEVLSELADGDDAMILYDMDVRGLGAIRVVEHFTIADGKIVRLRQIHDTAQIRAAGLDQAASDNRKHGVTDMSPGDGYEAEIAIEAPRRRVFEALTTLEGLAGWWASSATGSGSPGANFELGFAGLDETITWRVDTVVAPSSAMWTCLRHTGLPDWDGTKIVFELREHDAALTVLKFRHIGLVPELECYEQCHAGWEHFLPSLRAYAERGQGTPFAGQHHR
jgi:uncharacterized protein YndB with AHSA1/START domain/limonene-1,2-epoxide hydrolase